MTKNYYRVLGVPSNATPKHIKSAYRRRAKTAHPDHTGRHSGPFLEIQEAYSVLSDPVQRLRHDRSLTKAKKARIGTAGRPITAVPGIEPLIPGTAAPEPMVPAKGMFSHPARPLSGRDSQRRSVLTDPLNPPWTDPGKRAAVDLDDLLRDLLRRW